MASFRSETERMTMHVKTLTPYLAIFPGNKLDERSIFLYARALAEYEPEEVSAAMLKLLKTATFFPRVSEIVSAIESLRDFAAIADGKRLGYPSEGEAWMETMENVRHNHVYKPWTYSHPLVEQAVKQFGKLELINLKPAEMNTARAQFMRIYKAGVERDIERKQNSETLEKLASGGKGAFERVSGLSKFKVLPVRPKPNDNPPQQDA